MKITKNYSKISYFIACFVFSIALSGCKEKESLKTAFYGLPESSFIQEAKTSIQNKKPIAVSFTAEWCPHCKQYKPIFNEVKEIYKDQVTFISIDVDDEKGGDISDRFQVKGIPTTAFVRGDGSVFKVEVGELDKEKLKAVITELIASKKRGKDEPVAPFPIEKKADVKAKTAPAVEKPAEKDVQPQEIIKEDEPAPDEVDAPELDIPEEEADLQR